MKYFRILLIPFSGIHWLIISFRHFLYDQKLLSTYKFNLPVIVLGNLETGGTGKTPFTMLIAKTLKEFHPAILSRGYGRKSRGFHEVSESDHADFSGDEPTLMKIKLPETSVFVCENRPIGIRHILSKNPKTGAVILDDAFQHRKLQAGFSLLLFNYASFQQPNFLLPAGNRRDVWSRRLKADILIITKCPTDISNIEKEKLILRINSAKNQNVFFSSYAYSSLRSFNQQSTIKANELLDQEIILVTGIADASPIRQHLYENQLHPKHFQFADHYRYTRDDIQKIHQNISPQKQTIIITTEKDFVKINPLLTESEKEIWYTLPVEIHLDHHEEFKKIMLDYVKSNS